MNLKPEQIEQIKLFDWIRSRPDLEPYCLHIANERRTSPQQGRTLKRMGVRSGASDVFIGVSRETYSGMFLELKAGDNKPTENQFKFIEDMSRSGYFCVWCTGYEHARKAIEDYLALGKTSA
jgi:hypothetical protein